jgi:hypothetical protein
LTPDNDDEKWVTYREMTAYVEKVVAPVRLHAEEHDAWHRGILQAEAGRIKSQIYTALSIIVASAAVVVAAVKH